MHRPGSLRDFKVFASARDELRYSVWAKWLEAFGIYCEAVVKEFERFRGVQLVRERSCLRWIVDSENSAEMTIELFGTSIVFRAKSIPDTLSWTTVLCNIPLFERATVHQAGVSGKKLRNPISLDLSGISEEQLELFEDEILLFVRNAAEVSL
jgi:hypothetical protein